MRSQETNTHQTAPYVNRARPGQQTYCSTSLFTCQALSCPPQPSNQRRPEFMPFPTFKPAKRLKVGCDQLPALAKKPRRRRGFVPSGQLRAGDPYRIRTDVNGVRGRCLNHLTNGPSSKKLAPFRSRLLAETPYPLLPSPPSIKICGFLWSLRTKDEQSHECFP